MNSQGTQPILFVCAKTPVVVFQVPLWMLPKTVRTLVERKGGIDKSSIRFHLDENNGPGQQKKSDPEDFHFRQLTVLLLLTVDLFKR